MINKKNEDNRIIVIMEDSEAVRRVYRAALEKRGYSLYFGATGVEVMNALKRLKRKPNAIVLDASDSLKIAFSVIEKMRAITDYRDIPILVCVASSDRKTVLDFMKIGIGHMMLKPFEEKTLLQKIRQVVARNESQKLLNGHSEKQA